MIWQGTYGNDIYNNTRYYGEGMFGYTNCFASTKDRYRAEELSFTNPVSGVTTIYLKIRTQIFQELFWRSESEF